ncbi:hypothetical protein [Methanobrevibacter olleyae]|uniref:Fusaric acid resistance protein-like n=1 Tax=Methanobrevibacter olleyae TaxID=294671 RepID=A0A126QZC3_METOL|nr:hypothetical protein [Methanobrevibacter olleyae]AMK15411.1 hypothetical protein YLM1_0854 [Methanobrevibacter olleyae]SFL48473.1 hypothetical protein SAMN02910297_01011 [Methanobrevibacter olleyae]
MKKEEIKKKTLLAVIIILFLGIYGFLFGIENLPLGLMILFIAVLTLDKDLSFKPKTSFLKILFALWALTLIAFYNSYQTTAIGIILNFLAVFSITFSSYYLFSKNSYMGYLIAYFIMLSKPITIDLLTMRLFSLLFGAAFIVLLNIIINHTKEYKSSKRTIDKLLNEIDNAIDLKLKDKAVDNISFNVQKSFYLSIFDNLSYKLIATKKQEQVLNIVKSLQYIGILIAKGDFNKNELNYMKNILEKLKNKEEIELNYNDIKTKEMYLVLLNFKVINNELNKKIKENKGIELDKNYISQRVKNFLKFSFSKHSIKFSFALKMAFITILWQILGFVFDLVYIKWLYFTSVVTLLPYTNDMIRNYKIKLKTTFLAIILFIIMIVSVQLMNFLVSDILIIIALIILFYLLILKIDDLFYRSTLTAILSLTVSLKYIPLALALPLKIIWTSLAILVSLVLSLIIMPYSLEKESQINMKLYQKANNKLIYLIKEKCLGTGVDEKYSLIVIANLLSENIEENEIHKKQKEINELANAMLNYLEIIELNEGMKENIVKIINKEDIDIEKIEDIKEKMLLNTIAYIIKENHLTNYN